MGGRAPPAPALPNLALKPSTTAATAAPALVSCRLPARRASLLTLPPPASQRCPLRLPRRHRRVPSPHRPRVCRCRTRRHSVRSVRPRRRRGRTHPAPLFHGRDPVVRAPQQRHPAAAVRQPRVGIEKFLRRRTAGRVATRLRRCRNRLAACVTSADRSPSPEGVPAGPPSSMRLQKPAPISGPPSRTAL